MKILIFFSSLVFMLSAANAGTKVQKSATAKKQTQKRGIASEMLVSEQNENSYIEKINKLVQQSTAYLNNQSQTFCVGKQAPAFMRKIPSDSQRSETKIIVGNLNGKVSVAACEKLDHSNENPCDVYLLSADETKIEVYLKGRIEEKVHELVCLIDYERVKQAQQQQSEEEKRHDDSIVDK